jgi:hypothetical protein
MEKEAAIAIFLGDEGGSCGGGKSLDGQVAGEGEGDFARVEDAGALVELGFTKDGDAQEVAGPDEEAFGRRCRGGRR